VRVLHLISGGDSGGAKTHVLSLLSSLNEHIRADLVCYKEAEFSKEAREMGIPTRVFEGGFDIGLKKTREVIENGNYDIVHCHGSRANLTGALLKKHFDIPFISTVHSDYKLDYLGRPMAAMTYGQLNKMALRHMDYRVCVSDQMRETLIERGFEPNKLFPIYNGVDFSRPKPEITRHEWFGEIGCDFPEDSIVVGIAARFDAVKDVATTVRGFAGAARENDRLRLLIAGDGREREMLESLCGELGVRDKVFFAGWINGMDGYYASVDINAISSLSETFPYAVTEAARAGIPTVASRVGGLPKLIINGETGMLFNPQDHETMTRCILALANDEQLRKRLGQAVYDKAKREFSTESTCRRQLKIYKTVIERYRKPRCGAVICGAYGHGNAGDEALLTAIAGQLRSIDPDMRIVVVSKNARHTKRTHGLSAIRRWQILKLRRELKRSKLFISGGGSLIQDVTSRRSLWFYLHTILLAKKCGCRVQMYGCGMGPLNYDYDRKRAAATINRCVDAITLRDPLSLEFTREIGVTVQEVLVTGDPVLNLRGRSDADAKSFLRSHGIDPDGKYVCLGLRNWPGFSEKSGEIRAALQYCYDKHGLTPLFMPMNYDRDAAITEPITRGMSAPFKVMPKTEDAELEIAIVRQTKLCVAMRLHSLLYAACGEVPSVGLSYDPKVTGCAQYLGISCIEFDEVTAQSLIETIDTALSESGTDELDRRFEYIKNAEKMNIETARRLLGE
jgi:L-malate glycosyltransferase